MAVCCVEMKAVLQEILSCLLIGQLLHLTNGQLPEVAFMATSQEVAVDEDAGSSMFCIVLVEDGVDPPALPGLVSSLSVTLEFNNASGGLPPATFTGSGTPPDDLSLSSTQLLFNNGTMEGDSRCVTITGISDDDAEGMEYLEVNIESNSTYNINTNGTASTDSITIMVLDSDAGMQIMINTTGSDITALEGDTNQQRLCVQTEGVGVLNTPVTVAFGLSGEATLADIQGFTAAILEAGVNDPSSCALFSILDDDILEGDQELTFTIFGFLPLTRIAITSPSAHVFTIVDNEDLAVVSMQMEAPFCATITGLPAGGLGTDIVVDFEVTNLTAVAEEDYIVNSSTVMTFTSGTTSNGDRVCVDIILPEDDVYEEDEEFTITIKSVSPSTAALAGSLSSITIILQDINDAEVVFVMDKYNISEDRGSVSICVDSGVTEGFEVALTAVLSAADGTASVTDDVSLPSPFQVVFSVGQTVSTSCIDIPVTNDVILENNEEFTVTILTAGSLPHAVIKNPSATTVTIVDDDNQGFCSAEIKDDGEGYGEYRWSESKVGSVAHQMCIYSGFGDNPLASRPCNEGGVWGDVVYNECFTLSTSMYQDIDIQNTTEINVVEVVSELEELVGNTTSTLDQTQMNFNIVTNVVSISRQIIIDANLDSEDVFEVVHDVVEIVDTVIDWPKKEVEQNGSLLIETYEELASTLAQRDDTDPAGDVVLSLSGENSAIVIEQPPLRELSENGRTFSAFNKDGAVTGMTTFSGTDPDAIASIRLPPELFQGPNDVTVGLVFTVYINSTLFPLANTSDIPPNRSIQTPIIGAIVVGQNETENLTEPVLIDLSILQENEDDVFMNAVCVSWDFRAAGGRGNWTDRDCETEYTPGSCRVLCKCSHLTNFAALVDICSRTDDDCRLSRENETALTVVSTLGAVLSIIGLILTIFTMLAFKNMRDRDISKFHTQLSLALLGMLLVFVTGIDRTGVLGGCVFVSVLIHYFTLSAVMWMGAEAVLMFQKLVRVFTHTTKRQIVIISFICWVVPILLVVVPLSIDPHGMVSSEDLQQMNQEASCKSATTITKITEIKFCFIGKPAVFFGTFLSPILAVFIFNGVIFVMVTKVLLQHSFMSVSAKTKSLNSKKRTIRLILSIFGIMTLFGLTWIFGAFTISGASTAFQYLFALCNSLQGFMIFIFFCVIPKDTRESWTNLLFFFKLDKLLFFLSSIYRKSGIHSSNNKTLSNVDPSRKISTQSELHCSSEEHSSSAPTVPQSQGGFLTPISEGRDSQTEIEMKPMSSTTSDKALMREAVCEVITNHAAVDSITENHENNKASEEASPPKQEGDQDLSMTTEPNLKVYQSNIYPSLPEVEGQATTAIEKQPAEEATDVVSKP